jgi:hypothetical protein
MNMDQKLSAAKRHFPDRYRAIEEFAMHDDDFYSLCGDLADAEAEVTKWKNSASPLSSQRRAEYLALASDLAKEIDAALDAAAVIRLENHRPKAHK